MNSMFHIILSPKDAGITPSHDLTVGDLSKVP
jgi:hypothetical protein